MVPERLGCIEKSNVVGGLTGRSSGFAPWRILFASTALSRRCLGHNTKVFITRAKDACGIVFRVLPADTHDRGVLCVTWARQLKPFLSTLSMARGKQITAAWSYGHRALLACLYYFFAALIGSLTASKVAISVL
jgi:hypothetical protein